VQADDNGGAFACDRYTAAAVISTEPTTNESTAGDHATMMNCCFCQRIVGVVEDDQLPIFFHRVVVVAVVVVVVLVAIWDVVVVTAVDTMLLLG
jgi:hypothetical protein